MKKNLIFISVLLIIIIIVISVKKSGNIIPPNASTINEKSLNLVKPGLDSLNTPIEGQSLNPPLNDEENASPSNTINTKSEKDIRTEKELERRKNVIKNSNIPSFEEFREQFQQLSDEEIDAEIKNNFLWGKDNGLTGSISVNESDEKIINREKFDRVNAVLKMIKLKRDTTRHLNEIEELERKEEEALEAIRAKKR